MGSARCRGARLLKLASFAPARRMRRPGRLESPRPLNPSSASVEASVFHRRRLWLNSALPEWRRRVRAGTPPDNPCAPRPHPVVRSERCRSRRNPQPRPPLHSVGESRTVATARSNGPCGLPSRPRRPRASRAFSSFRPPSELALGLDVRRAAQTPTSWTNPLRSARAVASLWTQTRSTWCMRCTWSTRPATGTRVTGSKASPRTSTPTARPSSSATPGVDPRPPPDRRMRKFT